MSARPALLAGACALSAVAVLPASAVGQVARFPLETKSGVSAARVAVDPGGVAAALYPAPKGLVRLQVGAAGRSAETVPIGRGAIVEGLALGPGAQPFVVLRDRLGCSPLAVLTRGPEGAWTRESLGIQALTASISAGPDGSPGVLAARCDGSLSYHSRAAAPTPAGTPRAWPGEQTGARIRRLGRLSLAIGTSTVVAGVSGIEATVQVRGIAGWVTLPFPQGTLTASETVGTLMVGLDSAQRPVVLTSRGPRRRSPFDAGLGTPHQRAAQRYDLGLWERIPTVASPVLLASGASAFALLDQEGNLTIETATGSTRVPGRPLRLGLGAGGLLAQIQLNGGAYELQVGQ